jgi:phosphoglycerate dehydrogenase-like enzyme
MDPQNRLLIVTQAPETYASLVRALVGHRIRGAVLDVFETEPLPETSPLWDAPNLLITPHNAAVGFPESVVEIFTENYRRFVAGKPLQYVVDFERGY